MSAVHGGGAARSPPSVSPKPSPDPPQTPPREAKRSPVDLKDALVRPRQRAERTRAGYELPEDQQQVEGAAHGHGPRSCSLTTSTPECEIMEHCCDLAAISPMAQAICPSVIRSTRRARPSAGRCCRASVSASSPEKAGMGWLVTRARSSTRCWTKTVRAAVADRGAFCAVAVVDAVGLARAAAERDQEAAGLEARDLALGREGGQDLTGPGGRWRRRRAVAGGRSEGDGGQQRAAVALDLDGAADELVAQPAVSMSGETPPILRAGRRLAGTHRGTPAVSEARIPASRDCGPGSRLSIRRARRCLLRRLPGRFPCVMLGLLRDPSWPSRRRTRPPRC